MEERKRFQNQTLNSEDYEKTEEVANAVRKGSLGLIVLIAAGVAIYGPAFMKKPRNLRK